MSSEWIGKDEPWPSHSRPEAQKALKFARSKGFLFRKTNSHAFGRMRCAAEDDPCEVSIHSTSGSGDGSTTAGVVRDLVRKCPHRSTDTRDELQVDSVCPELSMRLDDCGRILDAVEELMARDEYVREFEQQLDQSTTDGDEHFFAAVELESLAAIAEQQSLAMVAEVRNVDDWPPAEGAGELLADVAITLDDASSRLASGDHDCPKVEASLQRIRARYQLLIK